MTKHKKRCVCGHLLDVEEVYQQGRSDGIRGFAEFLIEFSKPRDITIVSNSGFIKDNGVETYKPKIYSVEEIIAEYEKEYCEFEKDELVEVSSDGKGWKIRHFAGMSPNADYPYSVYDAGDTSTDYKFKVCYRYCRKYGTLGGLIKEQANDN